MTSYRKTPNNICRQDNIKSREVIINKRPPRQQSVKQNSVFSADTTRTNNMNIAHRTNMGKVMQNLIGQTEKNGQAPAFITGKAYTNQQWCAYTMTYAMNQVCAQKGIKNPTKGFYAVSQYIDWATKSKRYRPIKTKNVSKNNMTSDRKNREKEIKAQLSKMKEGDLIIWKSEYYAKALENGKGTIKHFTSSHIGMIEKVVGDYVYVIEGNANVAKSDNNYERYINSTDSIIGDQKAGEIVEINQNDGVIRKRYSISDLAKFGYSGFIDMKGLSD